MNNNTFYKTFTGTDALAFAIFPNAKPILLGSLTTISYSIYREKKPVPLVGKINAGGFTRGMRSIAGSMIFTLVNQHFTKDLVAQIPYLNEHKKMKADELPFFDVMIVCANEYGSSTEMMIYGVDFIEDGQVLSVQDLYIESTFGFVARDIDEFTFSSPMVTNPDVCSVYNLNADTIMPYDFSLDGYKHSMNSVLSSIKNDDLIKVQSRLYENNRISKISGVFDNEVKEAVGKFQDEVGINRTGYIDEVTYKLIMEDKPGEIVTVENKNGAFVYADTNKDNIVGISKYRESHVSEIEGDFVKIEFYGSSGYIEIKDTNLLKVNSCSYKDMAENGVMHSVSLANFDPAIYGAEVTVNQECEVKITTCSHYSDGTVDSNFRFFNFNKNETRKMQLSFISDGYIYNMDKKEMPKFIEFFIMPSGCEPRKWMVEIK